MYLELFGLRQLPFRLRPDPAFWVADAAIRRAHDGLSAALRQDEPRCVVHGEPGIGKTLLAEIALGSSARTGPVVRIHQPEISAAELADAVALQLSSATADARGAKHDLAGALVAADAGGAAPLLLIDHAQLLGAPATHALTECAAAGARFGLLLVTREEPGEAATKIPVRQAHGEARAFRLRPFDAAGVETYVDTRLRVAGATRRNLFTTDACERLFHETRGVPRAINVLCDLALNVAASRRADRIGAAEILEAMRDPRWVQPETPDPRPSARPAAVPGRDRIVVIKDARAVADLPLVPGRLQIGRAADNDLALESKYVSRRHCELITVTDGRQTHTMLVDLGSSNGTLVNGRRVKRHRLSPGDVVQVGDHELRCLGPGAAGAPPT